MASSDPSSERPPRIAYFVSSHGFGHATRAAAVMTAMTEITPEVEFDIFTQVPEWVFDGSVQGRFRYHACQTDVGLIQDTPLIENVDKTLAALDAFLPFDDQTVDLLAGSVTQLGCHAVVSDIAPIGIPVAAAAAIPSILVENFTWDWIYQSYASTHPQYGRHAEYLASVFDTADYHVQAEPVCHRRQPNLTTAPIFRAPRQSRQQTRQVLGIPDDAPVVLLTMGGTVETPQPPRGLDRCPEVTFVYPGTVGKVEVHDNLVLLPPRSELFYPDLVAASDAVLGKVGVSTLAEAYSAGVPFGYIVRPNFPESEVLASFIEANMAGIAIHPEELATGTWLSRVPELLACPRLPHNGPNGAAQAAAFILNRCD